MSQGVNSSLTRSPATRQYASVAIQSSVTCQRQQGIELVHNYDHLNIIHCDILIIDLKLL